MEAMYPTRNVLSVFTRNLLIHLFGLSSVASVLAAGCSCDRHQDVVPPAPNEHSQTRKPESSGLAHGDAAEVVGETWIQAAKIRHQYVDAQDAKTVEDARRRVVQDLEERFGNMRALTPNGNGRERRLRFDQLMREWNPIGFDLHDLKRIAGKPTEENPKEIAYYFDTGYTRTGWVFHLDDECIVGVRYSYR